ncbi:MAG TPA: phosphopyruvate hydratase [Candidatus Korarchaeota archaeon]|nr:phosphopyruvate hydratase [Candidatus Korarchaeota archaeon]
MKDFLIEDVRSMEVLDSRGNPTVKTWVRTSGGFVGSFSVPSGASKGVHEAVELRDGGRRLGGKGVLRAVANVEGPLAAVVIGRDVRMQREIDLAMVEADGTPDKSRFGANAILSVSMAVAKAAAVGLRMPLYRYVGGSNAHVLPVPLLNVLNGGLHAGNDLAIQEFMIVPAAFDSFREALYAAVEVYRELGRILVDRYGKGAKNLGDEGGYAPPMKETREALDALMSAIEAAGHDGKVFLALDAAASSFYRDGKYSIDGRELSAEALLDYYERLLEEYPIISVEDPFYEEDFETLARMTRELGDRIQIVGDDYFTTNVSRLKIGISRGAANSLLWKINQVGTLTEALEAARLAQSNGYSVIVSHRSGETTDAAIADLAVAINAGQIKTGAPARGERVAKYNRLLEIEEDLGSVAVYPGLSAFRRG